MKLFVMDPSFPPMRTEMRHVETDLVFGVGLYSLSGNTLTKSGGVLCADYS